MKPIKKEDMPKLIVLIVLTIGMFGFALSQFMSNPSASVAATPVAPGPTPAAGQTVTSAAADATSVQEPAIPTDPELDFLHIGPPAGGKDPFTPNGPAAPIVPTPTPVVVAPIVRPLPSMVANSNKRSNLEKLLGLNGMRPNGAELEGQTPGGQNPGPVVVELPAPSWNVTGIVLAERDSDGIKRGKDVAILRDSTGNRRFVTVGDPVDNGYHVVAVRLSGVEIQNKKHKTVIRLDSSTVNSSQSPGGVTTSRRETSGINGATTRAN